MPSPRNCEESQGPKVAALALTVRAPPQAQGTSSGPTAAAVTHINVKKYWTAFLIPVGSIREFST